MIIVAISGGPGNQLFQYAAGRYLADRLKCSLVLDYSWYNSKAAKKVTKREFILDHLLSTGSYDLAIAGVAAKIIRIGVRALSLFSAIFPNLKYRQLNEKTELVFEPEFDNLCGNIFINGFWQAWHYTEKVNRINFSEKFTDICEVAIGADLCMAIKMSNTICVSVRRGSDYGKNLQVCSPSYYSNSVAHIVALLNNARSKSVYIFSDNIGWCKGELKFDIDASISYIDEFEGVEKWKTDLYLSALCENHVISNSSFSWWAATLGQRNKMSSDKYVVAPRYWWSFIPVNEIDIYPKNWIVSKVE